MGNIDNPGWDSVGILTAGPRDTNTLGDNFWASYSIAPMAKHPQNSHRRLARLAQYYPLGNYGANLQFCPLACWCLKLVWGFAVWHDCRQHDMESRRTRG